ncbi:MAG TPA: hypothetical protein VGE15_10365 [Sphingobacteriaceae bacterium]
MLLLLLWYSLKDRGSSAVASRGLNPRTEIHAPVQTDLHAAPRSLDYRRAADELLARDRLEEAEREFADGRITAADFHTKATPLVSRIDFWWPGGPDGGPA